MAAPEVRAGCEFRVAGRTLSGVAMRYGDVSPDFRERFMPGAFGAVSTIPINLQHDGAIIVAPDALLTDSPRELRVRAELPAGSAALALVRRGALNGFSIEFRAQSERREAGVRVVERADLTGLALVDRGAYPGARAEVRARSGRTIRARIPSEKNLGCRCSGAGCRFARFARFAQDVLAEAIEEGFREGATDALVAAYGSYQNPLASSAKGTVRARVVQGGAEVDIDLPAGPEGDQVLRAAENAGIIVRPYLDADRSRGTVESLRAAGDMDNVMVYETMRIRAIIIAATDEREGWPEPVIVPTPGMDGTRAAPDQSPAGDQTGRQSRRRIWL